MACGGDGFRPAAPAGVAVVPNVAWSRDNAGMTIATAERYAEMLDAARRGIREVLEIGLEGNA